MNDMGIIIWVTLGIAVLISIESNITRLRKDIKHLNITLEKIAKQIGVLDSDKDDIDVQLKDLLKEGKKIEAIKKYRAVEGIGLKEAKEYIDVLSKDSNQYN
jgi:ribosomal protein L7/L12